MADRIRTVHKMSISQAAYEIGVSNTRDLISLAVAFLGRKQGISAAERELLDGAAPVHPQLRQITKGLILAGADPLGDAYCALRSQEERRNSGSIYTPAQIVKFMTDSAAAEIQPSRIVDAGCGSGRFAVAAAKKFPKASLIGVDNDPLAVLLLRANAAVLGFSNRLAAFCMDFRELELPRIENPTLFIGNPPFVRHHGIDAVWKTWFSETANKFGYKASKLAGLHIHFFLKVRELGRQGDFGAFITSAEWLDVNYGSVLRRMLADGMGGTALHVISPESNPFPNATTTGAIAYFRVGERPTHLTFRKISSPDSLSTPAEEKSFPWAEVENAKRWSSLGHRTGKRAGFVELGELCRVHRGQVTGANAVWIVGKYHGRLPAAVLTPAITSARELIRAAPSLDSAVHLKRVVDLPVSLESVGQAARKEVERFLEWAKEQGAERSYVAQHRAAWWSIGFRVPAPILCTYMARRMPVFVRNKAEAKHLNIAHGLYPRVPLHESTLLNLVLWLNANTSRSYGRTYSGGLTKFEPRELERVQVPEPTRLVEEIWNREHTQ